MLLIGIRKVIIINKRGQELFLAYHCVTGFLKHFFKSRFTFTHYVSTAPVINRNVLSDKVFNNMRTKGSAFSAFFSFDQMF